MPADVAQARSAKQCIADGMQQHVGIGMSVQSAIKGNVDAADDELAARHQCMNIEALSYTHILSGLQTVIPAKAGIQGLWLGRHRIPAPSRIGAGMTLPY